MPAVSQYLSSNDSLYQITTRAAVMEDGFSNINDDSGLICNVWIIFLPHYARTVMILSLI